MADKRRGAGSELDRSLPKRYERTSLSLFICDYKMVGNESRLCELSCASKQRRLTSAKEVDELSCASKQRRLK